MAADHPWATGLVVVSAVALAVGAGVSLADQDADAPCTGETCSWGAPAFAEEFDGDGVDAERWTRCYYWRDDRCTNEWNDEQQVYVAENVSAEDGRLVLTARREDSTGYLMDGTRRPFSYTSGMVTTEGRFEFRYGRVEARARVPEGTGLWSALWLLPTSRAWPPEIDVMEAIGSTPDRVHMTLHRDDGEATSFTAVGPEFSAGWHVFAVDWRPDELTFLVDGEVHGRVTDGVPRVPMYLLANLAVGGDWPGPPDADTTFPARFEIDYVRVWTDEPAADAGR